MKWKWNRHILLQHNGRFVDETFQSRFLLLTLNEYRGERLPSLQFRFQLALRVMKRTNHYAPLLQLVAFFRALLHCLNDRFLLFQQSLVQSSSDKGTESFTSLS